MKMNCFSTVLHGYDIGLKTIKTHSHGFDNNDFEISGVFFEKHEKGGLILLNSTQREKVVILPLYHNTQKECTQTYIISAKEKINFEQISFKSLCLNKVAVYDTSKLTSNGIRGLAGGQDMKSVIMLIPALIVEGAAYTRTKSGFIVKASTTGITIYPQQGKNIKIGHVQLSFSSQGIGYSNNTEIKNAENEKSNYITLNFPKCLQQDSILYNINIMLDVYPECHKTALGIE